MVVKHDHYIKGGKQIRVFKKNPRRIFWPKKDEIGDWRRLQNEEFRSFYSSSNVVREMGRPCSQNAR